MAPLDLDTQRLLESALYGTPTYHGIRTPDGRIVTELNRLRLDEDKRHGQMTRIQGELVENLRRSNHGSTTITRSDFDSRSAELLPAFREAASRIQDLNHTQAALLNESRALERITSQGFNAVEGQLIGVRSDLREVSGDIVQMDAHVTGAIQQGTAQVTDAVHQGTRTLHGPSFPAESLTTLVNRGQLFFDALGVYSKGYLTPAAAREVEQLVNQRLGAPMAKAALKVFIDQKVEESVAKMREEEPDEDEARWTRLKRDMKKTGYELGSIIDNPSQLIGRSSKEAREKLAALQQISRVCPDAALHSFIRESYGLISLFQKAGGARIPTEFLLDLTNSGLVSDSLQHQVKRENRGARLEGTDVDRNYNLMELLDQGDYAAKQRDRLTEVTEDHLRVGEDHLRVSKASLGLEGVAVGQREDLKSQGVESITQRRNITLLSGLQLLVGVASFVRLTDINKGVKSIDGKLTQVVSNLAETNDHLVNLERIGVGFIDAVNYGFKSVNDTLVGGFNLVTEGLDELAAELAISRAVTSSHLQRVEDTIRVVGIGIVSEIAYTNQLLERLVALQEESLRNVAQQRLKVGLLLLKTAETPDDFMRAVDTFKKGIAEDESLVENQFGLAVASEHLEDSKEARVWYRETGRLAPDEKKDLAVAAWVNFSRLEEMDGNFPSAIAGLRSALERDPKNVDVRFGLARLLALSGLEDEAEEIILQLVEENVQFLFRLKLDRAFSPDLLARVYTKVWDQSGVNKRGLKVVSFLLEELAFLGEKEKAICIFKHLMKGGPRLVLQQHILSASSFPALVEPIAECIKTIIADQADCYSAEDWYAIALIASRIHQHYPQELVRLNLSDQDVLQCFRRGLGHDAPYLRGNKASVSATLEKIDKGHLLEFIKLICSVDPGLSWLSNNPQ